MFALGWKLWITQTRCSDLPLLSCLGQPVPALLRSSPLFNFFSESLFVSCLLRTTYTNDRCNNRKIYVLETKPYKGERRCFFDRWQKDTVDFRTVWESYLRIFFFLFILLTIKKKMYLDTENSSVGCVLKPACKSIILNLAHCQTDLCIWRV